MAATPVEESTVVVAPKRRLEEEEERETGLESSSKDVTGPTSSSERPLISEHRQPSLKTHSAVDFSTWFLFASGRNKYGNVNWNLRAPEFNGNVFNFHELPGEGREGDPWSTIVWDIKAETLEGAPSDKVKIAFEISDQQEASIQRMDKCIIDLVEKQSMEVLSQKSPVKRELIASQHYKSALYERTETRGPKVKMSFIVRNNDPNRLGVMHYIKLKEDGETYENVSEKVRGWQEIEPLISGHMLRGAKVRVTAVRCWSISVMKKEIYPTMEIIEMYVREPKRDKVQYVGLSLEQQEIMNAMA
jgi:hypothetical protein